MLCSDPGPSIVYPRANQHGPGACGSGPAKEGFLFGRQLHKFSRQQNISGESFAMAAKVLLDKWHARGCDPEVLTRIRKDVFDIGEPTS